MILHSEATKVVTYEVRPLMYTPPVPKGQESWSPYEAIFASTNSYSPSKTIPTHYVS